MSSSSSPTPTVRSRGPRNSLSRSANPAVQVLAQDASRFVHEQRFALGVTGGFIVINIIWWIVCAAIGWVPSDALTTTIHQFDIITLFLSLFFTHGVLQLIIEAILMLIVLALATPKLGALKTSIISLASAIVGVFVGLAFCRALSAFFSASTYVSMVQFGLSSVTLVIGAMMAATAYAHALWRRRVRIVGYAAILIVLLYSGNPGDYCTLAAAIIGQIVGRLMAGPASEADQWHWQYSSSYEVRYMFGAIGVVFALGPLVAMMSRTHAGALTSTALLVSPQALDASSSDLCAHGETFRACLMQDAVARVSVPGTFILALMPVALMLIIARGLFLGRRAAVWGAIIFNVCSAAVTLGYYFSMPNLFSATMTNVDAGTTRACIVNAALPILFAAAVAIERKNFWIRTDARVLKRGVITMVIAFVACALIYMLFYALQPQDFMAASSANRMSPDASAKFLTLGFMSFSELWFVPRTAAGVLVYQVTDIASWLVVDVMAFRWLRSSEQASDDARDTADDLVETSGESMSFMTTWEGNDYWLSATGRSAVAYRVINGIALTTTGPFGDEEEWISDLDEFSRFCTDHSWSPVFYAVHEKAHEHLKSLGWHSLTVGMEMVIDPREWKTTGKKWQDIRTAINKAKREGIVDVYSTFSEAPSDVRQQIEEISEQWTSGKSLPEMKFTLGGVDELKDPRVMLLYAIDGDGVVQGVTSWLPTWRDGKLIGWTLDFMRHRTDSPNGIMEFLIARMAQRLHDAGEADPSTAVEFMSLSAAPLAGLDSSADATSDDDSNVTGTLVLQHSLALVADFLEPAYGFRSLFNFKKKFQPHAYPVYLCYPDSAQLVNIGLAILRAYLPSLSVSDVLGMLTTFKPEHEKKSKHDEHASHESHESHESHDAVKNNAANDNAAKSAAGAKRDAQDSHDVHNSSESHESQESHTSQEASDAHDEHAAHATDNAHETH